MIHFRRNRPLLAQLETFELEFDQKLQRALEVVASNPDIRPEDKGLPDSYLTLALYRLNTTLSRLATLDESRLNLFHEYKNAPKCEPSEVFPSDRLCMVLNEAAGFASPGNTIGAGHFLRAVAKVTRREEVPAPGFNDQVLHGTFSVETLLWGLGYHAWTPLADAPKVEELFFAIEGREPIEDVQYLMAIEGERIVFRPTSILDTFQLDSPVSSSTPKLAILTHFKEQYGGVTPSELMELEDIINNPRAKELDFQRFFEEHPQFFRRWDRRDIYPHVFLTREDEGPLIPDFLLVDPVSHNSLILDLKLPKSKIVRRQKNRDRFTAAVNETRSQLIEYRSWFDDQKNRDKIKQKLGVEIYKPHLGVVIGSSSEFRDAFDRQKLQDKMSDVELVTYDEIVSAAQSRLTLIRSASR